MKLTDSAVRNAKPSPKTYRLPDGRGLYLVVPTTGNKQKLGIEVEFYKDKRAGRRIICIRAVKDENEAADMRVAG